MLITVAVETTNTNFKTSRVVQCLTGRGRTVGFYFEGPNTEVGTAERTRNDNSSIPYNQGLTNE